MSSALTVPVKWFVDDVTSALTEISRDAGELRTTVANDAFTLAAGFVDADERLTDPRYCPFGSKFKRELVTIR